MGNRFFYYFTTIGIGLGYYTIAFSSVTYIAKKGDKLSNIASKTIHGPVWGDHGSCNQVLALNPQIKNPNLIYPGQEINLPADEADSTLPGSRLRSPAEDSNVSKTLNTPPTDPGPVPVETMSLRSQDQEERSLLRIAPRFSYNRIDATDRTTGGTSTLGSNLSLGADLTWEQVWSKKWSSEIHVGYDHVNEQTTGKVIDQSTFTQTAVGVSLNYHSSLGFHILSGIQAETAPFVRSTGPTSVMMDSILIPEIQGGLSLGLVETNLFRLSAGFLTGLRLPSSQEAYRVETGYDYKVFFGLEQIRGNLPLFSQVFFDHISQGTTITGQSESAVGLTLGFGFDLSPGTRDSGARKP